MIYKCFAQWFPLCFWSQTANLSDEGHWDFNLTNDVWQPQKQKGRRRCLYYLSGSRKMQRLTRLQSPCSACTQLNQLNMCRCRQHAHLHDYRFSLACVGVHRRCEMRLGYGFAVALWNVTFFLITLEKIETWRRWSFKQCLGTLSIGVDANICRVKSLITFHLISFNFIKFFFFLISFHFKASLRMTPSLYKNIGKVKPKTNWNKMTASGKWFLI